MHKVYKEFLPHQQAWDLACAIDVTPAHWWAHSHKHSGVKKPYYAQNTVNQARYQNELDQSMRKSVEKGYFTYRFHRTTSHKDGCNCHECEFKKETLMGPKVRNLLVDEFGMSNPQLGETFISAYHPGDFLGQHTDENKGNIAFIFHLSWKWRPEYGGLFHVEKEEGDGFDTYVPGWGDLVLMDLGETGQNHFVSEVTQYAPRPRLAVTGWFQEGS